MKKIELNSRLDRNRIQHSRFRKISQERNLDAPLKKWSKRERVYRVFNEIIRIDRPSSFFPTKFHRQLNFSTRGSFEKRGPLRLSQLSPPFVSSSSLGMLNPIHAISRFNVQKCFAIHPHFFDDRPCRIKSSPSECGVEPSRPSPRSNNIKKRTWWKKKKRKHRFELRQSVKIHIFR